MTETEKEQLELENFKIQYQHAWNYFQFHAAQRVTLFKYYITFLSILSAGAVFLLNNFPSKCMGTLPEKAGICVGVVFILISVIFMLLDYRNTKLLERGKEALKELEKNTHIFKSSKKLRIFIEDSTSKPCIGHTKCFNTIFILGIIVGLIYCGFAFYSCDHPSTEPANP